MTNFYYGAMHSMNCHWWVGLGTLSVTKGVAIGLDTALIVLSAVKHSELAELFKSSTIHKHLGSIIVCMIIKFF